MKRYKIKKGNHYSLHLPKFHYNKQILEFEALFTDSCNIVTLGVDKFDINKLYGISFGFHQQDSIRIGWRCCSPGLVELFTYMYNDGIRSYEYIGKVEINKWVRFKIDLTEEGTVIVIASKLINLGGRIFFRLNFTMPKIKVGYYLYPYYGGNRTAPQDTEIILNIK